MLYFVIENETTGRQTAKTCDTWDEFHRLTFSPRYCVLFVTDFSVKGKTYNKRKAAAESLGVAYSNTSAGGLFCSEYFAVVDRLETIAKRFGLVREFRENGII